MFAQIVGALGIAASLFIYQQKDRSHLLVWKLISDVLWACHYLLLGAYTAMAISTIAAFREIVFFNRQKRWASSKLWFFFFMACAVGSAVLTWKTPASLLPAVASLLSVTGFYIGTPRLSRILVFPISGAMLTYDLTCDSYMGIVNEVLTILSAILGILRAGREQKRRAAEVPTDPVT